MLVGTAVKWRFAWKWEIFQNDSLTWLLAESCSSLPLEPPHRARVSVLTRWQLAFPRPNDLSLEKIRGRKPKFFYSLVLAMTHYHFCLAIFVRIESQNPAQGARGFGTTFLKSISKNVWTCFKLPCVFVSFIKSKVKFRIVDVPLYYKCSFIV